MLEQAVERFDWVDLRGFAAHAQRPRGRTGHDRGDPEHMVRRAAVLPLLRGSGQGGDGWMVAAVHERG